VECETLTQLIRDVNKTFYKTKTSVSRPRPRLQKFSKTKSFWSEPRPRPSNTVSYFSQRQSETLHLIEHSNIVKSTTAAQLVGHPYSVRSDKQTSVTENSFGWCWCAWCTETLSKIGFKHANCLLSLTRCQGIPASVPSSISWMNAIQYNIKTCSAPYVTKMLIVGAIYEALTVGREMWIT